MESAVNNCEGNELLPEVVDGEESMAIERVVKLEPIDDEIEIDFEAYGHMHESVLNDPHFEYLVKNEPEIDSSIEPRPEKVGFEFVACDENVITVSPKAVFMCQSLEKETTNKRALQLHHRLDSEAEDDGDERIISYEEHFSSAAALKIDKQKLSEIFIVNCSNEFDRKMQKRAIVVLQRCVISSSSRDELVLAKTKIGKQKRIPESSEKCELGTSETESKKIPRKRRKERIEHVSAKSLKSRRRKANETPEEREKRRRLCEARMRKRARANETAGQRKKRLEIDSVRERQKTAEQRKARLAANLEGKNRKSENTHEPPERCELDASESETGERKEPRICRKRSITNAELLKKWGNSEAAIYQKKRLKYEAEEVRQKGVNDAAEKRKEPQSPNAEKVRRNRTRKTLQERVEPVSSNALKMSLKRRRVKEMPEQSESNLTSDDEGSSENEAIESAVQKRRQKLKKRGEPASSWNMKMKQRIANETPEERKIRLAIRSEKTRLQRANETPEQRKVRLAKDVERKRRKLVTKDPENAAKMRQKRANATPEQKEARLAKEIERRTQKRANETPEQRQARLAKDAERLRRKKTNATPEQIEAKRAYDAERQRRAMANQTPEQREKRLAVNAEKARRVLANKRATETPEQREARLAYNREVMRLRLANETPEQRTARRAADLVRKKQRIANETPEQREKRLAYATMRNSYYGERKRQKETRDGASVKNPEITRLPLEQCEDLLTTC